MDHGEIIGPSSVPLPGSDLFVLSAAIVIGFVAVIALSVLSIRRILRRRRGQPPRRRVGLVLWGATAVLALCIGLVLWPFGFFVPEFPQLPRLFPENAFIYTPATGLPLADGTTETVEAIGDRPLFAATSGTVRSGRTGGLPFNLVDSDTPRYRFDFAYPGASDDTGYPIPDPAYIQSMPFYYGDNHYVGIDLEGRRMWELANIRKWFWSWQAGGGALWDLDSLEYPKGLTTASGLPLIPLAFGFDEVTSGSIDHVLAISMPTVRAEEYQWPARHTDGPVRDPAAPMMGTWFRLRSDADLSGLGPQARVIAEALQEYGAVLMDTGGSVAVTGLTDSRWDDDDLRTLTELSSDDLEVVDATGLMIDPQSMEAAR